MVKTTPGLHLHGVSLAKTKFQIKIFVFFLTPSAVTTWLIQMEKIQYKVVCMLDKFYQQNSLTFPIYIY